MVLNDTDGLLSVVSDIVAMPGKNPGCLLKRIPEDVDAMICSIRPTKKAFRIGSMFRVYGLSCRVDMKRVHIAHSPVRGVYFGSGLAE